jgi:hypothetical protein
MAMTRDKGNRQDIKQNLKLNLVAGMLRCRGTVRLKAWGISMLPAVWPGDMLTIQGAAYEEIAVGDIVLVLRDKRVFIHRLIEKELMPACFITKGDSLPHYDPPAPACDLLGRVIGIRRANRNFVPAGRVSPVHSFLAWSFCRSPRFRGLALHIHKAFVHGTRNRDEQLFGGSDGYSMVSSDSLSRVSHL